MCKHHLFLQVHLEHFNLNKIEWFSVDNDNRQLFDLISCNRAFYFVKDIAFKLISLNLPSMIKHFKTYLYIINNPQYLTIQTAQILMNAIVVFDNVLFVAFSNCVLTGLTRSKEYKWQQILDIICKKMLSIASYDEIIHNETLCKILSCYSIPLCLDDMLTHYKTYPFSYVAALIKMLFIKGSTFATYNHSQIVSIITQKNLISQYAHQWKRNTCTNHCIPRYIISNLFVNGVFTCLEIIRYSDCKHIYVDISDQDKSIFQRMIICHNINQINSTIMSIWQHMLIYETNLNNNYQFEDWKLIINELAINNKSIKSYMNNSNKITLTITLDDCNLNANVPDWYMPEITKIFDQDFS
jgi:hypothetical protein